MNFYIPITFLTNFDIMLKLVMPNYFIIQQRGRFWSLLSRYLNFHQFIKASYNHQNDVGDQKVHLQPFILFHVSTSYCCCGNSRPLLLTKRILALIQYLVDEKWKKYYLLTTSNFGLYIMCFISFYYCIRIKNSLPPYLPQPRIKSQLKHNHPLYT